MNPPHIRLILKITARMTARRLPKTMTQAIRRMSVILIDALLEVLPSIFGTVLPVATLNHNLPGGVMNGPAGIL
jgi:hypothetical protein